MERLSPELMVIILKSVEDFSSLSSLIRTSHFTYNVFKGARSSILSAVLQHSLPEVALQDALAAEVLSQMDPFRGETVLDIWLGDIEIWTQDTYPSPTTDSFDHIVHVHVIMEWLMNNLYLKYMEAQDTENATTPPLLPVEKVRIYRAFYRMQYHCYILYGRKPDWTARKARWIKLGADPLWDNDYKCRKWQRFCSAVIGEPRPSTWRTLNCDRDIEKRQPCHHVNYILSQGCRIIYSLFE